MTTQAALGKTALETSNFEEAVKQLTYAIATNASTPSPVWLSQRSTAYQRLGKHDLALADAEAAVLAARSRQRRELIAQAQFRRAVALHGLKRFGDARLCLTWVRRQDEKFKALGMWQAKVVRDFDVAGGENAEANKTVVKEWPDEIKVEEKKLENHVKGEKVPSKEENGKLPEQPLASVLNATPKEKIRHEFYQSNDKLTITVFAKGVPKDKGEVIIKEGSLEISFPVLESNSTYDLSFDPLYARIDPSKSSYRITPHKIEIFLHKSVPGNKWPSLEGTEIIHISEPSTTSPSKPVSSHTLTEKAPAYPTSSKNGPKDWDALASSALKTKKGDGKEEIEDDEGGDPANAFFKQLYKNADPDTQRAMMKSFQESNGTALSTNWDEVRRETVKTQPPDGVVAKKWGE